ncbi:MAG TPA: cytochrome-c peroxidase, partial [Candidatus Hypogeohydataceae bacterium YC38]
MDTPKTPLPLMLPIALLFTVLNISYGEAQQCVITKTDGGQRVKAPLGLPDLEVPKDNPMTPEKVALGKRLYFDKRLSLDDTVSCASCHDLR